MKKLFSPFPHVLPIALTSGHTFVVTQEPVDVPDMYVAEAISRGALEAEDAAPAPAPTADGLTSENQASNHDTPHAQIAASVVSSPESTQSPAAPTAEELAQQRAAKIKDALIAMVDGSDDADFTSDGKPQLARVKARTGFAVNRVEVDAAWTEVSNTL